MSGRRSDELRTKLWTLAERSAALRPTGDGERTAWKGGAKIGRRVDGLTCPVGRTRTQVTPAPTRRAAPEVDAPVPVAGSRKFHSLPFGSRLRARRVEREPAECAAVMGWPASASAPIAFFFDRVCQWLMDDRGRPLGRAPHAPPPPCHMRPRARPSLPRSGSHHRFGDFLHR
jgi:hypothetical protein